MSGSSRRSTPGRPNRPVDAVVVTPRRRRRGRLDSRSPVDLFEYQGKQLFAQYGIPVSPGEAVTTVDDAVAAADKVGYPVVIKAQVHVGGRGKAGGVKLAANADEAREHATFILGLDIKGHIVETVWVEHAS